MAALNPVDKQKLKLKKEKGIEDDYTVGEALMPNESVLGLDYDCTVVAALNPLKK